VLKNFTTVSYQKKNPRYGIWFHYETTYKIQSRQCLLQQRIMRISDFLFVCSFSVSVLYFLFMSLQVAKIPVAFATKRSALACVTGQY